MNMKKWPNCVALTVLFVGAVVARSGAPRAQDDIVGFLQAQPVSRWELGLLRLEQALDLTQWAGMPELTHGAVRVGVLTQGASSPRATRILISFDTGEDLGHAFCARAVDEVRDFAGVKDGKLKPERAAKNNGSAFAAFFSPHPGQGIGGEAGYGAKVDKLFVIEVKIRGQRCRGPLLGTGVIFSAN